jgi:hypothetical protein
LYKSTVYANIANSRRQPYATDYTALNLPPFGARPQLISNFRAKAICTEEFLYGEILCTRIRRKPGDPNTLRGICKNLAISRELLRAGKTIQDSAFVFRD